MQAILALRQDPDRRRTMGENGQRYVAAHYDRASIARLFEKLLLETVDRTRVATIARNVDEINGASREVREAGQVSDAQSTTGDS